MMGYIVPSQNSESRNFYNSGELDVNCLSGEEQCVSRILGLFRDYINGTLTLQQSRCVHGAYFFTQLKLTLYFNCR